MKKQKLDNLNTKIEKARKITPDFAIGLNEEEVAERVSDGLNNRVPKKVTKSYWKILQDNVFTFFNAIYFVLTILMIYGKTPISSFFFLGPVTMNILIGVVTDIRARHLVDKLRIVSDPKVHVVRSGKEQEIDVRDVVLSDIVVLNSGDQVVADGILVNGRLHMNESLVTGESDLIDKAVGDTILSGTYVQNGKGYVRVTKVGVTNYAESLQSSAKSFNRPKSELKASSLAIFFFTGVIAILFGFTQVLVWFSQNDWNVTYESYQEFIGGLSGSLVAMIPAGLYLLTSLTLGVGLLSLAKQRMNVQELYCIEMLARVDTVCFDKTGTLTDGDLGVSELYPFTKEKVETLGWALRSIVEATGDDNATAKAVKENFDDPGWKASAILPFDSARKYSAATFVGHGTYVMGAPGYFEAKPNALAKRRIDDCSMKGLRVLGLYYSKAAIKNDQIPAKLELVGVLSLTDHIKEDAKANIEWFQNNSVAIKIISGDNPVTVSQIAERCGVEGADKAISMQGIPNSKIPSLVKKYVVFGRVSPEQKALLVSALQKQGHKVAMTGDGVNDILALKKADCSIAMASGASAARNVSHIVSMDNDFSKLPKVVAEGRRVINNLQRTASLFLSKTIFAIIATLFFLIASFFGKGAYPFTTSNMLLWEVITIGAGGFLLALQPSDEPLKGHFLSTVLGKALPSGLMEFFPVLVLFVVSWIEPSFVSAGSATSICVLLFSFLSFVSLFIVSSPFDKYRRRVFLFLLVLAVAFLFFDIYGPYHIWGVDYKILRTVPVVFGIFAGIVSIDFYFGMGKFQRLMERYRFWRTKKDIKKKGVQGKAKKGE